MAGQTKMQSMTEAVLNVVIGYGVAVTSQVIVFPWFGVHSTLSQNLQIGLVFTVISLCRSYIIRRIFNKRSNENA